MHDGPWNRRRRCYQLVYVPASFRSDNSQRQYWVRRAGPGEYSPPGTLDLCHVMGFLLRNTALLLVLVAVAVPSEFLTHWVLMVGLRMLVIIVLITCMHWTCIQKVNQIYFYRKLSIRKTWNVSRNVLLCCNISRVTVRSSAMYRVSIVIYRVFHDFRA
jgi:hypothetical protein